MSWVHHPGALSLALRASIGRHDWHRGARHRGVALLGLGGSAAAAMGRVAVAAALDGVVVVDSSRGRRVHEPRVVVVGAAMHPRHWGLVSVVLAHLAAPPVGAVCTAAAAHIDGRAIGVACSISADDVLGTRVASCAHVGAATVGEVAVASSVRASARPASTGSHPGGAAVHVAGRHRGVRIVGRFGAVARPVVGGVRAIPEDVSVVRVRAGCVERRPDRVGHGGRGDFVGLLLLFGVLVATSGPDGDVSQHTAFGPVALAALSNKERRESEHETNHFRNLENKQEWRGGGAIDCSIPHLAEVAWLLDVVIVVVTELGVLAGAPRARAVSLRPGKLGLLPASFLRAVIGVRCVVVGDVVRLRAVVLLAIGQLLAVVATFGAPRVFVFVVGLDVLVGLASRVFRGAAAAGIALLLGFALARSAFS